MFYIADYGESGKDSPKAAREKLMLESRRLGQKEKVWKCFRNFLPRIDMEKLLTA